MIIVMREMEMRREQLGVGLLILQHSLSNLDLWRLGPSSSTSSDQNSLPVLYCICIFLVTYMYQSCMHVFREIRIAAYVLLEFHLDRVF